MKLKLPKVAARTRQFLSAGSAVALAVILAIAGVWLFRPAPKRGDGPLWRAILSDRVTLGFVRVATLLLALFVIASIAALAADGRWIKGFTSGGLTADDSRDSDQIIAGLREELARVTMEREQALRLLWGEHGE